MIKVECENCKKMFYKTPQKTRIYKHNFCSYKCKFEHRKKHPYNRPNVELMRKIKRFAEFRGVYNE